MPSEPIEPVVLETGVALTPARRYAHLGKRRRSYTDELFRCPIVDQISRSTLVCNHLLWRDKISELRDHLSTHLNVESVAKMTDAQVREQYTEARCIMLEPIPEDELDDLEDEDLDVEPEDDSDF